MNLFFSNLIFDEFHWIPVDFFSVCEHLVFRKTDSSHGTGLWQRSLEHFAGSRCLECLYSHPDLTWVSHFPHSPSEEQTVYLCLFHHAFLKFLFYVLAVPHSTQDLSFPTRDRTQAPAVKVSSPSHWTARELLFYSHFEDKQN